jgi:hypothetical protein
MRRLVLMVLVALALGLGVGLGLRWGAREKALPDPPSVAIRVREVARLEALDVALYKKVTFSPDPSAADSFWGDVGGWVRHTFAKPHGKAIVFAEAHLGLDLEKLGPGGVEVVGRKVYLVLPPIRSTVELRPGETEIVGSNLDSAETARLLELAKVAFERETEADPGLRARARASAERAIRALLSGLGFEEVHFVDALPAASRS